MKPCAYRVKVTLDTEDDYRRCGPSAVHHNATTSELLEITLDAYYHILRDSYWIVVERKRADSS